MDLIDKRIKQIEEQEQDVKRKMAARLDDQTKVLQAKLEAYLHSTDFKTKFCTWNNCAFPPYGTTWETTKDNVNIAIKNRFEEFLIQWENDNQVYSGIHRKLLDEFRTRFDTCVHYK